MKLSTSLKRAVERHALDDYPRECCGLVVAAGNKQRYVPCRNAGYRAPLVGRSFHHGTLDCYGLVRDLQPSEADKVSCEATGLPWHIVAVGQDAGEDAPTIRDWHSFVPSGYRAPLVGRSFHHGTLDCYGLVCDFYARELCIDIPNFERPDDWWAKPDAVELYLDNFEAAGFVRVNDGPRYGDVILMQYRSERTNHAGVYIGNSELKTQQDLHPITNAMLHHAMPRLSERVLYAGYWQDITRMIVRHRGFA